MSDETVCGRCRLPIHRDSPMQHFGTFVTHQPNECVRLLRAENERLVKEVEHWREVRRTALLAGDILKADNLALRQDAERYRFQREFDWRYRVEHYGASEDERSAYIAEYDANYDAAMKEKNNES